MSQTIFPVCIQVGSCVCNYLVTYATSVGNNITYLLIKQSLKMKLIKQSYEMKLIKQSHKRN